MRQTLLLLFFSSAVLLQYGHAQVTTVKSPAANQPKLNMPTGLPAKIKQVDSLRKIWPAISAGTGCEFNCNVSRRIQNRGISGCN
jgi:hypothetical protein